MTLRQSFLFLKSLFELGILILAFEKGLFLKSKQYLKNFNLGIKLINFFNACI
tara:strand:+ start:320 stop:478 length:159 start_codon:yes stop_codon:yes gene_type:complete